MIRTVRLLARARADRDDIWTYTVSHWGEDQAIRYVRALNADLQLLAEFPEMAPLRKEFAPPIRIRVFRSHLIVYEFDDETLTVVRLLATRSNWQAALSD